MQKIVKLLEQEIKEVVGCTEPACIAFAFSKASSILSHRNFNKQKTGQAKRAVILKAETGTKEFSGRIKAKAYLSRDIYRNASTVKIPGLKLRGIKPAVACGIYTPVSTFNPFAQMGNKEKGKIFNLIQKKNWLEIVPLKKRGIFVKAELKNTKNCVQVIIEERHDNIKEIVLNGKRIFRAKKERLFQIKNLEEIKKIVEIKNKNLEAIAKNFLIKQGKESEKYGFKDTLEAIEKLVEKRMEGEKVKITTITGSGNHGILLTLPFYEIYKKAGNKVISAVLFSILVQIYLTQKEGRISDLCGLANKGAPSLIAGLSYYYGESLIEIKKRMELVKEVLRGLLCEGAKKSCALKAQLVSSSVFKILG
jgi:L-cysteine desulfidase